MSLMIASPVYGQAFMPWVESILRLQETLFQSGLKYDFCFMKGDSLVQRARNNIVASFLKTDYERLLFIDSDLEFNPEAVQKLWNLNVDVCAASYPMKKLGVKTTVWKDGNLVDLDKFTEPFECDYAGTGFLMIKREVFEIMQANFPERSHMEGRPDDGTRPSHGWFYPHVSPGDNREDRTYLSEDYAFCDDYRSLGGKIICDPSIKLKHWGTYGYGSL